MSDEEKVVKAIERAIYNLPDGVREQCKELVAHIEHVCAVAGPEVGALALALCGAKAQLNCIE